jgi:hypothetical protein
VSADQQAIDAICREIRRAQDMHDSTLGDYTNAAVIGHAQMIGEIIGLRKALCALLDWPLEEAAHEGKADTYVREWQAQQ